jgi:DNA-binding HxlR family transcriptional regulator
MPVKKSLSSLNCSLAKALDIVGDGWTMLILRDLFLGATRFGQFASSLGIARNILTERLEKLVATGLVQRKGSQTRPTYHLTDKGFDFVPSLIAIMQWGDRWLVDGQPPLRIVSAKGKKIADIQVMTRSGKPLKVNKILVEPGPGAKPATTAYITMFAAI